MTEPSLWVIEERNKNGEWSIVKAVGVHLSLKGAKFNGLYYRDALSLSRRTKIKLRVAEYRRVADAPREPGRTIEPREE